MSRLIDADELLERDVYYDRMECLVLRYEVEKAPTIEAEPVKHGRWEKYTISNLFTHTCTNCHCDANEKTSYCPNCGAKMEN